MIGVEKGSRPPRPPNRACGPRPAPGSPAHGSPVGGSSSGLACQGMGLGHREESQLSKVGIGPAFMVGQRVSGSSSLLLLAPQCA